jgi:hypothetical protein
MREGVMILVTGDVVLDYNLHAGKRMDPSSTEPGTVLQKAPGGAVLTCGILEAIGGLKPLPNQTNPVRLRAEDVAFGLKERSIAALENWPKGFANFATWEPDDPPKRLKKDKDLRWRLRRDLGFEDSTPGKNAQAAGYPATPAENLNQLRPRIVVIDDGALGFRHATANEGSHLCWPKLIESGPEEAGETEWILLKMASPLATGELWQALKAKWAKKLIVVMAARDLRRENIVLAQGRSWEQTVEDLLRQLDNHPALRELAVARHIVITLRGDGALWLDGPGDAEERRAHLVFDPECGEGEWEQGNGARCGAFGFLSVMAASLAWRLWESTPGDRTEFDLKPAMRAGLSASRVLWENGNGIALKDDHPPKPVLPEGFPFELMARELQKPVVSIKPPEAGAKDQKEQITVDKLTFDYGAVSVPAKVIRALKEEASTDAKPQVRIPWTILSTNTETAALTGDDDARQMPLFGPARRLALYGPAALPDIPCARFEALQSMDRSDIEALRSIKQLMLAYREKPSKQPLSIAVFGAPGSGKSFGLTQIAKGIFGEKAPILTFNLSQFASPVDLYGAYHQVRDKALAGDTPVVFWDEFDSGEYKWLQYLLAPMQDGVFQEGQLTHSIGRSVFIFAGGTSYDYEHFGPPENPEGREGPQQSAARQRWVMSKGPDFKSRLSAYLNILGPNPHVLHDSAAANAGGNPWNRDDDADLSFPMRRALLLRGFLGARKPDDVLEIDRGLLTALLEVGHYRNGARSMEKLLAHLRGPEGEPPSRALLPHRDLMEMFVREVDDFYRLLRPMNSLSGKVLDLAVAIHGEFCKRHAGETGIDPKSLKPWDELTPELRHSNIAAAERITEILALIGCTVEAGEFPEAERKAMGKVIEEHIDLMAVEEHNGWWDTKRADGWRYGPVRNNDRREHPLMIPFGQLPEPEKDKDRNSMRDYPNLLGNAGFRIVPRKFAAPD